MTPLTASPRRDLPPEGWQWRLLTDLARLESGHTPSRFRPDWWGGDIPWIALPDIRALDGTIAYNTLESTNEAGIANSSARVLPKDTVVLSRTASVGFVTVMGRPMATSQDFVNWICGEELNPFFLMYLFKAARDYIRSISEGAIHKTVYMPAVRRFEVCIPPRPVQDLIVARLIVQFPLVARARKLAEEELDAVDALTQRYVSAWFASDKSQLWPQRKLGDCSEIVSGITLGRKVIGEQTRAIPYLRVANVKDGYLDLDDVKVIQATEREITKLSLAHGDIVLTEGGDADKLGRGTYWQCELPECVHQNHIFRVRVPRRDLLPAFVAAQLGSAYGKAYFARHAKQTTGIATINRKVLSEFPLLIPPLEQQEYIAADIQRLSRVCHSVTQAAAAQSLAINALPVKLLRQAFSGSLQA